MTLAEKYKANSVEITINAVGTLVNTFLLFVVKLETRQGIRQ